MNWKFLFLIWLFSMQAWSQVHTVPAAPPAANPWILNFLAFADMALQPNHSLQWEEVRFGYNFTDNLSAQLDWGYNGLINAQNTDQAEIWDPEIFVDWAVPLSAKRASHQWTLLTGVSMVIPAAPSTVQNNTLIEFSGSIGMRWSHLAWAIEETNRGYVLFYRDQPTYIPFIQAPDEGDTNDETLGSAATSSSLTYYSTMHDLKASYEFSKRIAGKMEALYEMSFDGSTNIVQTLQLFSTVGYYINPHVRLFTGITSTTELDQGKKPPLFSYDSTEVRLGFYVKW